MTCEVQGQWIGIPVARVQEVLADQAVAAVPLAPGSVAGLLNLRGRIVIALDLRACLGLEPRESGTPGRSVVVHRDDELFALVVDGVGDVEQVTQNRLEAPPRTLDARWKECATGVVRTDRGLMAVLDIDSLLEQASRPGRDVAGA